MTIPEIIALAQAGFSAQQIAAMAAAPAPASAPAPAPATAPATAPAPRSGSPLPAPAHAADPVADMLSKLGVQVSSLTSAIQSSNLLASQQPKQQTADEILATIIAPPAPPAPNTTT